MHESRGLGDVYKRQGDTMREANTSEVKELKGENTSLKELVAELSLENRVLKKNLSGDD